MAARCCGGRWCSSWSRWPPHACRGRTSQRSRPRSPSAWSCFGWFTPLARCLPADRAGRAVARPHLLAMEHARLWRRDLLRVPRSIVGAAARVRTRVPSGKLPPRAETARNGAVLPRSPGFSSCARPDPHGRPSSICTGLARKVGKQSCRLIALSSRHCVRTAPLKFSGVLLDCSRKARTGSLAMSIMWNEPARVKWVKSQ